MRDTDNDRISMMPSRQVGQAVNGGMETKPVAKKRTRGQGEMVAQTLRLSVSAWRQLKLLAVERGVPAHDLLLEAVNDLFRKFADSKAPTPEPVAPKPTDQSVDSIAPIQEQQSVTLRPISLLSRDLLSLTDGYTLPYQKLWFAAVDGKIPAVQINGRWHYKPEDVPAIALSLGLPEPPG